MTIRQLPLLLLTAGAVSTPAWSLAQAPPPANAVRAAAHVDANLVVLRSPEVYQAQLAATTSRWEQFKGRLEVQRNEAAIDGATYEALMAEYTKGVGASEEGVARANAVASRAAAERAPARANPRASRPAAEGVDARTRAAQARVQDEKVLVASRLVSSEARLADAEVRLRIASRREGQEPEAVAGEAKAAMLAALASPDSVAVRSYVQARFPEPLPGEDWAALAARMGQFSGGLSMLMSTGPIASDLKVTTSPSSATVVIRPLYTETGSRTAQTEASFENLYRGLYRITVSLEDYQAYESELNFLDDLQPTLDCTMVPVAAAPPSGQTTCLRRRP